MAKLVGAAPDDQPSVFLADIKGIRTPFTAALLDYEAPCTMTENQACHIFNRLSLWNELLTQVCLELRQDPKRSTLLSLEDTSEWFREIPDEEQLHQGATLVHCLLKTHRCIATIELNGEVLSTQARIVLEALRTNAFVKTLKVNWSDSVPKTCLDILPSIGPLDELVFRLPFGSAAQILHPVSMLIRRTASLTVLDIASVRVSEPVCRVLLPAIILNTELKELSLCGSVLNKALCVQKEKFYELLTYNSTLTSLTVAGEDGLKIKVLLRLLSCLQSNNTLIRVTLRHVFVNDEVSLAVRKIIERNHVLRCLNLQSIKADHRFGHHVLFDSWLQALTMSWTLEEFTLPIYAWNEEQWRQFFTSLACEPYWKMTIEFQDPLFNPESYDLFITVQGILAECGAGRKVFFKSLISYEWRPRDEPYQYYGLLTDSNDNPFLELVQRLPIFAYISSANILLWPNLLDRTSTLAISTWIRRTPALKVLHLQVLYLEDVEVCNMEEFWSEITKSLSQNRALRVLYIRSGDIDEGNLNALATIFRTSQKLHSVHLATLPRGNYDAFVKTLHAGIERNYSMLSVSLNSGVDSSLASQWINVSDTLRRNCGLIARAAEYASGARRNWYGARALDRMCRHVVLAERISQLASVTEGDAELMVRESVKSFQEMHDFMRLAGVVRERVECYPREDGLAQLDNIGDCWTVLRRYLMLDHIKDPMDFP